MCCVKIVLNTKFAIVLYKVKSWWNAVYKKNLSLHETNINKKHAPYVMK